MEGTASTFVIYRHLTGTGLEYRLRLKDADGRTLARPVGGYREQQRGGPS